MHMEADKSSDCMLEAQIHGLEAASGDDDDDWVQFNIQESEGDAMRARLAVKYKLLHTLLRRASAGMVFKRIEEGSQGHYTLQRVESCVNHASFSDEAGHSRASSLPAAAWQRP